MSGQLAQAGPHHVDARGGQEPLDPRMLTFPDRRGAGERCAARSRENEPAAAPIIRIDNHFNQAAALKRFEICC